MYYLSILISLLLVFAFLVWYYDEPKKVKCDETIILLSNDVDTCDASPAVLYQPHTDDHLEYDKDNGNLEIVMRKKTTMHTLSIPDHVTLQ